MHILFLYFSHGFLRFYLLFFFFQSQGAHEATRSLQVFKLSENTTYLVLMKLEHINDFNTFLLRSLEF